MNMFSDLPTRLKNVMNPEKSDEQFHFDVIYEYVSHLVFRLLENLNFVTKVFIIWATYEASLEEKNWYNVHYKYAIILSMLALGSRFLILYSSIISFKYSMNQYSESWEGGSIAITNSCKIPVASSLVTFIRYVMLTFLGVLMTVIPIQILDVSRVIADLLAAIIETCAGMCSIKVKLFEYVDTFFENLIK